MCWRAHLWIHVVAVGDGAIAALQAHGVHGGDVVVSALLQTVHERRSGVVAPAPDAADVVTVAAHTVDGAGKDAAFDGGVGVQTVADEAAGVVAADVERGGDKAVLYRVGAIGEAHESRGVVACRGDGACHCQVLDSGVVDIVERSHTLLIGTSAGRRADDVCRDGVLIAKESAAERMVVA